MQNSSDIHILSSAGLGFLCSYNKKKKQTKTKTNQKQQNQVTQIIVNEGLVSVWGQL